MNLAQHFQAATSTGLENNEVIVGDASLEAAVADVVEAGYEVTEATRVAAEMQDVADSLESYREALTLSQESGNIDQTAASWMLAAGEAITSRVGVSLNSVSVESFASPSDASDAVELVSLEAGELWKKLVQAIKDLIAKARVALKGLWVKLTDGGAKLAKRGEALEKKARDTKGSAEEKNFEASFIGKVHLGGKVPNGSALVSNVKKLDSLAASVFEKSEGQIKSMGDTYKSMLADIGAGKDGADFSKFLGKMADYSIDGVSNTGAAGHLNTTGKGTVKTSDELLGGQVIYLVTPSKDASVSEAVGSFKIGMGNVAEKQNVDDKGEVEVLSTGDAASLGGLVKTIGTRISNFNKKFEARDKMKDMLAKELDKVEKAATKNEGDMSTEQQQAVKDGIRAARAVVEAADSPASEYARYLMSTLATAVAWAERSLSMYKES